LRLGGYRRAGGDQDGAQGEAVKPMKVCHDQILDKASLWLLKRVAASGVSSITAS